MSIYRRRLMIANALKKSDSNINYPGLIAAWSAAGKSNDDADRNVLRDLTGNGHDITLNGFAFNTEGSGYGHPEYPDALVFDGVDDYGINEEMPILTDYTIIVKRNILDILSPNPVINKYGIYNGAFIFEMPYYKNRNINYSFGSENVVQIAENAISWQTTTSYNQQIIIKGPSIDGNKLCMAKLRNIESPLKFAFYSAYLFDRSLDEQEIKAFIRKYIDADYVLPSEQTTE